MLIAIQERYAMKKIGYITFIMFSLVLILSGVGVSNAGNRLDSKKVNRILWYENIYKIDMGPVDKSTGVRSRIVVTKEEVFDRFYVEDIYENEEGIFELRNTYSLDVSSALKKMGNTLHPKVVGNINWITPLMLKIYINNSCFEIIRNEPENWNINRCK